MRVVRSCRRAGVLRAIGVLALLGWGTGGAEPPPPADDAKPKDFLRLEIKSGGKSKFITGVEAVHYIYDQGDYRNAARYGYLQLWNNIEQPEVLEMVADSLARQKQGEEAAVFYTLLLRSLEGRSAADVAKYRPPTERALKGLDREWVQQQARYVATAAGKRFTTPEAVSDLWMTQVRVDLRGLHGLYAWKYLGGRKDAKPDWIHNTQGEMHRSGAKHVDEAEGRKGLLFTVPLREGHADEQGRVKRPTQVAVRNVGKCRYLRLGIAGYGFPFLLNVRYAGELVLTKTIPVKPWSDLQIDLGDAAAKGEVAVLELVVPKDQRWSEGTWIDYMDFFDN